MNKKILVVDDDEDIVAIVSMVLEELGHEIISATSTEILLQLDSIKPDVIILDNSIGGEYLGSQICKELKSNAKYKDIKVILCSGVEDITLIAGDCKADSFLKKPFGLDELERVVSDLILAQKAV
ncbi:MAG TPA: response regulator [Pedobacter sp.]|jgi:DNA-binding response OmpR family regulator